VNPATPIGAIADAMDPIMLQLDYPKAVAVFLGQHGFNLKWIGLVRFIKEIFLNPWYSVHNWEYTMQKAVGNTWRASVS